MSQTIPIIGENGGTPAPRPSTGSGRGERVEPRQTPAASQIAGHFFNLARAQVDAEINEYARRNRITDMKEIHVNASGKPGEVIITLSHRTSGIAVIGTPHRSFKISLVFG